MTTAAKKGIKSDNNILRFSQAKQATATPRLMFVVNCLGGWTDGRTEPESHIHARLGVI